MTWQKQQSKNKASGSIAGGEGRAGCAQSGDTMHLLQVNGNLVYATARRLIASDLLSGSVGRRLSLLRWCTSCPGSIQHWLSSGPCWNYVTRSNISSLSEGCCQLEEAHVLRARLFHLCLKCLHSSSRASEVTAKSISFSRTNTPTT